MVKVTADNKDYEWVSRMALRYGRANFGFSNVGVVEIAEDTEATTGRRYLVDMAFSHSPEEIETIAQEGEDNNPKNAAEKRRFLQGEFEAHLTIIGDAIDSFEWKNTDLC